MPINLSAQRDLTEALGTEEADFFVRLAKQTERFEKQWIAKVREFLKAYAYSDIVALDEGRTVEEPDLVDFFIEHYFNAKIMAYRQIEHGPSVPPNVKRMARKTYVRRAAKDLKELQEQMREFQKGRYKPRIGVASFKEIQKEYLGNLKEFWARKGQEINNFYQSRKKVLEAFLDEPSMGRARAETIIRTETTRYQNEARTKFYNEVDDVTHYLFMAIRDHRTTKWCKTRHGLVYKKGSAIQNKETPPCHWSCRSEIVPLDPDNARHKRLIENESRSRENNSPEPLPKGWNRK
jgi:SPP1 gp7 family putative phage head morphogenesis protein